MVTRFRSFSRASGVVAAASFTLVLSLGCSRDPNVRKQKYLDSGNRFEQQGKHREAIIQYSNAIKVDSNFGDAHYALAKSYIQVQAMVPAYTELLRTVDLKPNDQQARLDLGNVELGGGLTDEAEKQAKTVMSLNPDNADAYLLLSNVELRAGKRDAAKSDVQHALQLEPNRAAFHTALALILGSDTQTVDAAQHELQKAIALDPKSASAHLVLGGLLDQKGDVPGALQQAVEAVRSDPKNVQARAFLSAAYMRSGDRPKTEQSMRQAADDLPDNKEAVDMLGRFYTQSGQLDLAASTYAELSSKHPESVPLKVASAQILITKGEFDKARPLIKDLDKKNGNTVDVRELNASLLLKDGKVNEAFDLLQKTSKEAPDNVDAQVSFGKVAEIKGDFAAAQEAYQHAALLSSANFEVKRGQARTALRRSDYNLLSQVANDTIARSPNFAEAYLWRGTVEASRNDDAKAEADFQTALKGSPDSTPVLLSLAQLRMKQRRLAEAALLLQKVLDNEPGSMDALSRLVLLDIDQKQSAKAILLVQQQIAKSPLNADLYGLLSNLLFSQKDFSGARDAAQKAMQLKPAEREFAQKYVQAATALGDNNAGVTIWQQWTSTHPGDAPAFTSLGAAQEGKGDMKGAIESYKKALALDPHLVAAANNLAYLMVETGQNTDVALSLAQNARQALPNSPNTADTLAWVYYHKGAYASARDLLEDALKQAPNNASMHYHLGMTYSQLGDKTNAALHLKKAVSLAAASSVGKQAQDALSRLV